MSWPSPSFADHLGYLASNDIDARLQPRLGAPAAAGVVLGMVLDLDGGAREVTWLRDRANWQIAQSYGATDGAAVVTVHTHASLGLTVTVRDTVAPAPDWPDVMVRAVTVERADASPVAAAALLTYANLSPVPPTSRIPELPLTDWAFDGSNDYAALWHADSAAVFHFHPGDGIVFDEVTDILLKPRTTYGRVGAALAAGQVDVAGATDVLAGLVGDFVPGAVIGLSTVPPPEQFQIGYDAAAQSGDAGSMSSCRSNRSGASRPIAVR